MKPQYGDIVVTSDGHPKASFPCPTDDAVKDAVALAQDFGKNLKLKAVNNGDPIPDVKVGRVCCDLDSQKQQETTIDYQFQASKAGLLATPQPK